MLIVHFAVERYESDSLESMTISGWATESVAVDPSEITEVLRRALGTEWSPAPLSVLRALRERRYSDSPWEQLELF